MQTLDLAAIQASDAWFEFATFVLSLPTPTHEEIVAYSRRSRRSGVDSDICNLMDLWLLGLIRLRLVSDEESRA
jgi:hypothetical protein